MFGLFFTEERNITSFEQVMACNQTYFKRFFHAMLEQGIYLAPSAFEAGFVSIAHDDEAIAKTISAAEIVFRRLS